MWARSLKHSLRTRPRLLLALIILSLVAILSLVHSIRWRWRDTERQRANLWGHIFPQSLAFRLADNINDHKHTGPAVPALLAAPWMGSWPVPELSEPVYQNGTLTSPALLMLHIFSTPTADGVERRKFMRTLSPLHNVPPEWRHLVEVKFVLGYPENGDKWLSRAELDREQEQHGDLVLLKGLLGGENMNEGKTIQWIEYLGTQSVREAQWVVKTDEDTLVLLPNLLDWLLEQDPSKPTYFGTTLTRWYQYCHYFEGMMYGLSWGVVKTIAAANIPRDVVTQPYDEDARTGDLMFSLPTAPGVDNAKLVDDHTGSKLNMSGPAPMLYEVNQLRLPPNPDPRTGLLRLDLLWRVGDYGKWWLSGPKTAIAWHRLKSEESYLEAHEKAETGHLWHGFMWHPPPSMKHLKDTQRRHAVGRDGLRA